jgi:hypothetical protein
VAGALAGAGADEIAVTGTGGVVARSGVGAAEEE